MRAQAWKADDIERSVRRWFVMSVLTGRYSGSAESQIDQDIRQIHDQGFERYATAVQDAQLSTAYWTGLLPQQMNTSSAASPAFRVFQAAQVKLGDRGFLSRDITVQDLILNKSDVHHLFPKDHLKKNGLTRARYNQIANYAVTQTEINIAISSRPPSDYFSYMVSRQCRGGTRKYGGIQDLDELRENMRMHCIPDGFENWDASNYDAFLEERRKLMATRIQTYYQVL